jgi:hypothetical protein
MKTAKKLGLLFCTVLLIGTFALCTKANDFDKLTIFTFSTPVELPGDVALPAGTYVFKLLQGANTEGVVQVLDQNQTRPYALLLTIPAERPRPTDKAVVEFYETASGPQDAVKAWFFAGETSGREFIYPKARAAELGEVANQPGALVSSNSIPAQARR